MNEMNVSSSEMNDIVLKVVKAAQSKSSFCKNVLEGTIEDAKKQELEVRDGVVLKRRKSIRS